jgi:alanine-alpha-ketoisovalerate/valine-pyruvate aminotransferase
MKSLELYKQLYNLNKEIKQTHHKLMSEASQQLKKEVDPYMWSITDEYQTTCSEDKFSYNDKDINITLVYKNISHKESEKDFFLNKLERLLKVLNKEFNLKHHTLRFENKSDKKIYYIINLFQGEQTRQQTKRTQPFSTGFIEDIF